MATRSFALEKRIWENQQTKISAPSRLDLAVEEFNKLSKAYPRELLLTLATAGLDAARGFRTARGTDGAEIFSTFSFQSTKIALSTAHMCGLKLLMSWMVADGLKEGPSDRFYISFVQEQDKLPEFLEGKEQERVDNWTDNFTQ